MHPIRHSGNGQLVSDKVSKLNKKILLVKDLLLLSSSAYLLHQLSSMFTIFVQAVAAGGLRRTKQGLHLGAFRRDAVSRGKTVLGRGDLRGGVAGRMLPTIRAYCT